MPKSVGGRKRKGKSLPKQPQKHTSKSGTKLRAKEIRLREKPDRRKSIIPKELRVAPIVEKIGTTSSAIIADTKASYPKAFYPLSVRAANNLIEEFAHCWITNPEITDLLLDLVRFVEEKE